MTRDYLSIDDFTVFLEHAVAGNTTVDSCALKDEVIGFCFYGSGNVALQVAYGKQKAAFSNTKGLAMSFFDNQHSKSINTKRYIRNH